MPRTDTSNRTGTGTNDDTDAHFELPDDHPGVSDPAYRARRSAIAAVGRSHSRGQTIADVGYTSEEDEVWRIVAHELARKHERFACRAYREGAASVTLPTERVPQLREVDARVHGLTGFHIEPVPGLVPTREFYGSLADRVFRSTQYVRHHTVPFYTPEPDIVHEIIGHANMLGNPVFADLYEAAGKASLRAESDAALDFFSKVFWFTLEFGVLWEDGELRTYGAGLLSSYGEIEEFRNAEVQPWDIARMGTLDYDITHYQPVLFAAESFERMVDDLGAFFDGYDDEDHRVGLRRVVRLQHCDGMTHAAEPVGPEERWESTIDELVAANRDYAATFDPDQAGCDISSPSPTLRTTVITCMDARIDLFALLGLQLGQVHMIRNAGGVVTDDVLRSLVLSQRSLGTREVLIVHHTDCGLYGLDDDALLDEVAAESGVRPPFRFHGFTDLEESVRVSVAGVRDAPFVPYRDGVRGFVYEVGTGHLREVV